MAFKTESININLKYLPPSSSIVSFESASLSSAFYLKENYLKSI
jgi:hypothetical protein